LATVFRTEDRHEIEDDIFGEPGCCGLGGLDGRIESRPGAIAAGLCHVIVLF
jgi:hypothetical protein